jgi:hypothetical protein
MIGGEGRGHYSIHHNKFGISRHYRIESMASYQTGASHSFGPFHCRYQAAHGDFTSLCKLHFAGIVIVGGRTRGQNNVAWGQPQNIALCVVTVNLDGYKVRGKVITQSSLLLLMRDRNHFRVLPLQVVTASTNPICTQNHVSDGHIRNGLRRSIHQLHHLRGGEARRGRTDGDGIRAGLGRVQVRVDADTLRDHGDILERGGISRAVRIVVRPRTVFILRAYTAPVYIIYTNRAK